MCVCVGLEFVCIHSCVFIYYNTGRHSVYLSACMCVSELLRDDWLDSLHCRVILLSYPQQYRLTTWETIPQNIKFINATTCIQSMRKATSWCVVFPWHPSMVCRRLDIAPTSTWVKYINECSAVWTQIYLDHEKVQPPIGHGSFRSHNYTDTCTYMHILHPFHTLHRTKSRHMILIFYGIRD